MKTDRLSILQWNITRPGDGTMWLIQEVKSGLYLGLADASEPNESPIVAVKFKFPWDIILDDTTFGFHQ
jgi:hypothetical protein